MERDTCNDARVTGPSPKEEAQMKCAGSLHDPMEDLDNLFTYHAPSREQTQRYNALRDAAKLFASIILATVPRGADRSAAIRKVREAVMTANAGIATSGY